MEKAGVPKLGDYLLSGTKEAPKPSWSIGMVMGKKSAEEFVRRSAHEVCINARYKQSLYVTSATSGAKCGCILGGTAETLGLSCTMLMTVFCATCCTYYSVLIL